MKRLHRIVGIALLLAARRRLRARELADHFGVSERTVYRDVAALTEAGYPVIGTAGDGYTLSPAGHLRPLALTEEEAEALVLGARMLETAADGALASRLQSATAKLEAAIGRDAARRMRSARAQVTVIERGRAAPGPLTAILDAVASRAVLAIAYDGIGRGERTEREIEPLGLVCFGDVWLLPAYCRLREDIRAFRLDRIAELRDTGERFVPREGFTLEDAKRRAASEPAPKPMPMPGERA